MDNNFVYQFNVENSEEFRNYDQLYQFFLKGQDIFWDNWWESQKTFKAREILSKQKCVESYFRGQINLESYRPAVLKSGLIVGNPLSFLHSFYTGREACFDIVN